MPRAKACTFWKFRQRSGDAFGRGDLFLNPYRCIYIYLTMSDRFDRLPNLPCLCGSFRRSARALTHLYDKALRPAGLRTTQFTILQALLLAGEVSQGELGRMLTMDSTTLTRTLEIMARHGWVVKQPAGDRRERRLSLGKAGKAQLKRALPLWEEMQARLRRQLGGEVWESLLKLVNEVPNTVTNKQNLK
jgi:DNA-binding MarR family transcriptional regulator